MEEQTRKARALLWAVCTLHCSKWWVWHVETNILSFYPLYEVAFVSGHRWWPWNLWDDQLSERLNWCGHSSTLIFPLLACPTSLPRRLQPHVSVFPYWSPMKSPRLLVLLLLPCFDNSSPPHPPVQYATPSLCRVLKGTLNSIAFHEIIPLLPVLVAPTPSVFPS